MKYYITQSEFWVDERGSKQLIRRWVWDLNKDYDALAGDMRRLVDNPDNFLYTKYVEEQGVVTWISCTFKGKETVTEYQLEPIRRDDYYFFGDLLIKLWDVTKSLGLQKEYDDVYVGYASPRLRKQTCWSSRVDGLLPGLDIELYVYKNNNHSVLRVRILHHGNEFYKSKYFLKIFDSIVYALYAKWALCRYYE